MVVIRLIDGTEYTFNKIEKPPPRKLTFEERNPSYDSNVNYKDKRYGKCYYVSNKAEENNPKPNSGTSDKNGNFENLKPIKGLIKDLI